MVRLGVLKKVPSRKSGRVHEYLLTEKGRQLSRVLLALVQWGNALAEEEAQPAITLRNYTMADEFKIRTCGVDHVGLSVRDLVSTRKFFCDCLGWRVVGERPDHPAVFVSDGHGVLTLLQVESPDKAIAFYLAANLWLHLFALSLARRP